MANDMLRVNIIPADAMSTNASMTSAGQIPTKNRNNVKLQRTAICLNKIDADGHLE